MGTGEGRRVLAVAVRAALVAMLVGGLFVQAVMIPLMAIDLGEEDPSVRHLRVPFAVLAVLVVLCAQVVVVCVWRLVTMIRRRTAFSPAAFREVDVMIGAFGAATVLLLAIGVVLAPGDAVPPGMVLLVGGAAVVAAGVGLVTLVMRSLLAQAISRDVEAHELRAELDAVI